MYKMLKENGKVYGVSIPYHKFGMVDAPAECFSQLFYFKDDSNSPQALVIHNARFGRADDWKHAHFEVRRNVPTWQYRVPVKVLEAEGMLTSSYVKGDDLLAIWDGFRFFISFNTEYDGLLNMIREGIKKDTLVIILDTAVPNICDKSHFTLLDISLIPEKVKNELQRIDADSIITI